MISVTLIGRLGNQMFQYATAYALARRRDAELQIDTSFIANFQPRHEFELWRFPELRLRPISLTQSIASRLKKRLRLNADKLHTYSRPELGFDETVLALPDGSRIHGYFQSERYFADAASEVRDLFSLDSFAPDGRAHLRKVAGGRPLCAVHVRRGDYVGHDLFAVDLGGYYQSAMRHLSETTGCRFIVFSDDLDWCKRQDMFRGNYIHFSSDLGTHSSLLLTDMALMSMCDHNIIANSTYSWWAAWLGERPEKTVVMPQQWLTQYSATQCGLVVPRWVQM